jgi:hypothetical protein
MSSSTSIQNGARGLSTSILFSLIFLTLPPLNLYVMRWEPEPKGVFDSTAEALRSHVFPNGVALKAQYVGLAAVDAVLAYLNAAFVPGVLGWDLGYRLEMVYLLMNLAVVVGLMTIEACRIRNRNRVLSL